MDKQREAEARCRPPSTRTYSDRALSAEETWAAVEPHLARYGITRMARLTGLDRIGIPVWNAIMPNAHSIAVNQGKGLSDMDARVSAAMEAIERAIAASPEAAPVRSTRNSLRDQGRTAFLLPELVASGCADPDGDTDLDWLPAINLASGEPILVPAEAATLDRTRAPRHFWQSSDGLASGNSVAEARLHGLLERLERDAEALWYLMSASNRARTCFDPADLSDPVLDDLVHRVRDAGLTCAFFDMTADTGMAAVMTYIAPAPGTDAGPLSMSAVSAGSGCHPDPVRAAIRAVTEAAQSRMTYISGVRDDIAPESFTSAIPESIGLLLGARPAAPPPAAVTANGDAAAILSALLRQPGLAGIGPILAVALSDPGEPFAVEKIIVPGLEQPPGSRLRPHGLRALTKVLTLCG